MRKSSESFELEHRGLHAVSERVADLRNAVKECEARFAVLDAASQGTAAVQARSKPPASRRASSRRSWPGCGRGAADQRAAGRRGADRARSAGEIGDRMRRIEELRPGIEEAVRDLATLKGTQEMMADGLEQMRVAYEEMSRLREGHGETQAWLQNADAWTRKVQAQVKELSGMEPAVERIRADVEQVKASMGEIEARREALLDVARS